MENLAVISVVALALAAMVAMVVGKGFRGKLNFRRGFEVRVNGASEQRTALKKGSQA